VAPFNPTKSDSNITRADSGIFRAIHPSPEHLELQDVVSRMFLVQDTPEIIRLLSEAALKYTKAKKVAVFLRGDDGNLYYYFHFQGYEGGSRHVQQGEVIGYTGNTGDASGGATHTHFEIHPGGGPAVNPYPTVAGIC